jgi:hypothetical protein
MHDHTRFEGSISHSRGLSQRAAGLIGATLALSSEHVVYAAITLRRPGHRAAGARRPRSDARASATELQHRPDWAILDLRASGQQQHCRVYDRSGDRRADAHRSECRRDQRDRHAVCAERWPEPYADEPWKMPARTMLTVLLTGAPCRGGPALSVRSTRWSFAERGSASVGQDSRMRGST